MRKTHSPLLAALLTIAVSAHCFAADTSDWQKLKTQGDAALAGNNYGVAEESLNAALRAAEKFGRGDVRLADTLRSLGNLYSTRSQFEKAQPFYERELRVREKALGAEHPDVVANVGRLAQFYLNHDSTTKADRLATLLLAFAERKVKEQQSVKDNLTKLDAYYNKSKDSAEAQDLLHKLQDKTQQLTANQGLELATTLDALGNIYKGRQRYDLAERMFKDALAFREAALSPEHLALACSYENLGNLYAAEGKSSLAQPMLKKSLAITEKTLQPGRPEAFKRLEELAQSYASSGQVQLAETMYKQAIEVMDKSGGNAGDLARANFALASLYLHDGKSAAAEPLMKRALKLTENLNGPQHCSVAAVCDGYADVEDRLGKAGEATKLRARSRSIRGGVITEKNQGSDF